MFRNAKQGIQKILTAVIVLALAMPSNLFAARPTASRNTRVADSMQRDFSLRAEIRVSFEDLEKEAAAIAKNLERNPLYEVAKPHLTVSGTFDPHLETSEHIIEAAYDRIWTALSPAARPKLDRVIALTMVLHSKQPVNPEDPRPYMVKPAGEVLTLANELAILEQPEGEILKVISYALLHRAYENPYTTVYGQTLFEAGGDLEGIKQQIARLITAFAGEEVSALIAATEKPDYDVTDVASVEAYYQQLLAQDPQVQLARLAEIAQELRDQELYSEEGIRGAYIPTYLKPVLNLLSEARLETPVKRAFLGILHRAVSIYKDSILTQPYRPYVIFSPDDEEQFPLFEQRNPGTFPAAAPPVREWAKKLAENDHVLSIDLPSLADLEGGLLDQLIRDGLIYSATTNNNGNLGYLREIQKAARGKRTNPILAEALGIIRKNPAISRKDAVAQAYENTINAFVARLAVKLYPIYLKTGGRHGFVSTELPTAIVIAEGDASTFENRVDAIVKDGVKRFRETQDAIAAINNGIPTRNILLKIPATDLGLEAGKRLEALGYSVNYTLVATEEQYRATVLAHKEGVIAFVKNYKQTNGTVPSVYALPQSVSSDFVSRDDRNVAKLIDTKAFDQTLQLLIAHVSEQRRVATPDSPDAQRLEVIYEKLSRVQALPADEIATNEERREIFDLFQAIRGTGPEGTTTAGLAFAQANIIDIWTAEFVTDEVWTRFLAENYAADTPAEIAELNKILSQQIYWASTGVKVGSAYTTNPFYLSGLVVPNTTNTVPRDVVEAIAKGETAPFEVRAVSETDKIAARETLGKLLEAGIDLGLIKRKVIFPEGLKDFNGSDVASYDILRDAVEIAALINSALDGEVEILEPGVGFEQLPSRLEAILGSRDISQVFVQGQLVQASLPQVVRDQNVDDGGTSLPNAAAPAVDRTVPFLPVIERTGNVPAPVNVPDQPGTLPNTTVPVNAPANVPQTNPAQPLAQNAAELFAPKANELAQVPDITATTVGRQPTVPQVSGPQQPVAILTGGSGASSIIRPIQNAVNATRIPLIVAEVTKIIPEIIKAKKDEHTKLDFILTLDEEENLRINFIRSEFRPLPENVREEAGIAAAQDQPEEVQARAEIHRYLDTAQSQLAAVTIPVIRNQGTVRRAALTPYSSNFDEGTIVDSYFAFDLGGLAAVPTLTGGKRPAVVILSDDAKVAAKQEAFVEAFNNRAGLQKDQRILVARSVEEAVEKLRHRINDPNVTLRAFVSSLGDGADTLKKQLELKKVAVSILTMKGFDQMVPKGSRLAAFVTAIRDQFIAFSKSV